MFQGAAAVCTVFPARVVAFLSPCVFFKSSSKNLKSKKIIFSNTHTHKIKMRA